MFFSISHLFLCQRGATLNRGTARLVSQPGSATDPFSLIFQNIISYNVLFRFILDTLRVDYDCVEVRGATMNDPCAPFRSNYTVFNYNSSCCFKTGPFTAEKTSYYLTQCYCQEDYCSGNIPESVGIQPASTMSLLNPTFWAITLFGVTAKLAMIGGQQRQTIRIGSCRIVHGFSDCNTFPF